MEHRNTNTDSTIRQYRNEKKRTVQHTTPFIGVGEGGQCNSVQSSKLQNIKGQYISILTNADKHENRTKYFSD